MKVKTPKELKGKELAAYRSGFYDGNEGRYFPAGLDQAAYDRGHADGKKYGPRKGKPWTLEELRRYREEI